MIITIKTDKVDIQLDCGLSMLDTYLGQIKRDVEKHFPGSLSTIEAAQELPKPTDDGVDSFFRSEVNQRLSWLNVYLHENMEFKTSPHNVEETLLVINWLRAFTNYPVDEHLAEHGLSEETIKNWL